MGRPVKTEKEVLAEIAQESASQSPFEMTAHSETNTPHRSPDTASAGSAQSDEFQFSSLGMSENCDFNLDDLVTPEGKWDRLTLQVNDYAGGARLSHSDWIKVSLGEGVVIHGDYTPGQQAFQPVAGMLPLNARYWFMRAAYETVHSTKSGWTIGLEVAGMVRKLCAQDLREGNYYHAETLLLEHDDIGDFATITTPGWPKNHPIYREVIRSLPTDGYYFCTQGVGLEGIFGALFGDHVVERVSKILSWVSGQNDPPKIKTLYRQNAVTTPMFLLTTNLLEITGDTTLSHKTRGLIADPSYFHPRKAGVKP